MCTKIRCSLDTLGRKIDRHNAASGGAEDLDRQHPYEPGTDHRNRFPNTDLGLPNALHRDGANGG
jgi:hypothetical protein